MGKKITKAALITVGLLLIPLLITMLFSGAPLTSDNDVQSEETVNKEQAADSTYSMEEYIMMAMAANIDLSMNMETLKAQAVIIRTNVYQKLQQDEDLTLTLDLLGLETMTLEELKESVSIEEYSTYVSNMENAIYSTKGQIMTYKDVPIKAYFHYANAGSTRNYEDVYGENIPYLVSVESGADVEAPVGITTKEYTCKEMLTKLKENYTIEDVTEENLADSLSIGESEKNGYVHTVKLKNLTIKGEEFQSIFSLNSTNFYFEEKDGGIRIVCKGKGSGLGFSQYGANAMANNGMKYSELLTYYYQGATLSTVN